MCIHSCRPCSIVQLNLSAISIMILRQSNHEVNFITVRYLPGNTSVSSCCCVGNASEKKNTLVGMHDFVKDDPGNSANNEAWHQAEEYYEVAWH